MNAENPAWRWQDRDLILAVHAQPGAKRAEIAGQHGSALKIRVQARPVDGAANAALIRFLAEQFEIPQRQISILQGETGREKVLRLRDPDHSHALSRLRAWNLV